MRPTVAVVSAVLNEGPDLEAMLGLLASSRNVPMETILVDDGSRDPIEPRVALFRRYMNIRVIRNERRLGSGPAKTVGTDAASSEVIVVMDSHLRPPWHWMDMVLDGYGRWPESLMCPRSVGFDPRSPFNGQGCVFQWDPYGWLDCKWKDWKGVLPRHGAVIDCIHGGCYVIGRKTLAKLGGYAPHHRGWGYEEQSLSWRGCASGHESRLLAFDMMHHYRSVPDRKAASGTPDPWEVWTNRHLVMASHFDEDRYERVFGPVMREHYYPDGLRDAVAAMTPGIKAARAHMATIRTRSDAQVGELLGLRIPDSIEEYRRA